LLPKRSIDRLINGASRTCLVTVLLEMTRNPSSQIKSAKRRDQQPLCRNSIAVVCRVKRSETGPTERSPAKNSLLSHRLLHHDMRLQYIVRTRITHSQRHTNHSRTPASTFTVSKEKRPHSPSSPGFCKGTLEWLGVGLVDAPG
jgi:hypothetical protein